MKHSYVNLFLGHVFMKRVKERRVVIDEVACFYRVICRHATKKESLSCSVGYVKSKCGMPGVRVEKK